mmetsp:Transcript_16484/g.18638  ORF Transcript_16484/g.18638 Transcript_16484/m.18638 type:complete len:310 (+) Transcript_16484:64-993(+)
MTAPKQDPQGVPATTADGYAIRVKDLNFSYTAPGQKSVTALKNISFDIPTGSRCLLLGANGAGKSTLLRILAGKHLLDQDQVVVLGKPAFFQTLGVSGITFLGTNWVRTVAFAGNNVPYQADIPVCELMKDLQDEFADRRDNLYEILEIEPHWRMHQVSDGQRRRVQIMLGLLRPFKLLLLDEMTVDLDVLARRKFLEYLEKECTESNATVVYATHIFDGMEGFATHVVMLEEGELVRAGPYSMVTSEPGYKGLYDFVVRFLEDMARRRKAKRASMPPPEPEKKENVVPFADRPNSGFTSGRMMSYYSG